MRLADELGRRWWTLQRFGYSPGKLVARAANRTAPEVPRVLCITVPKSGTHLLERALCLHPRLYRTRVPTIAEANVWKLGGPKRLIPALRPGQVLVSHLFFDWHWLQLAQRAGVARVVLVRDPRAILVSEAHYITRSREHSLHSAFAAQPTTEARIRLALEGSPDGRVVPLADRLARYATWLETGGFVVRFEDLVGAAGGGSDERQRSTLVGLYEHLGLPLSDDRLDRLQAGVFSARSPTFRRGRVDEWRDAFDDGLDALFRERAGGLLDVFGYSAS